MLEVCIDTLSAAELSAEAGAGRLELCSCLSLGGVTPSLGMIEAVVQRTSLPVAVLIRPRPGDFVYSPYEWRIISNDARAALDAGAESVVLGGLTPENDVDWDSLERLLQSIPPSQIVFHRAFDELAHPLRVLKRFESVGIRRVLTSGRCSVDSGEHSIGTTPGVSRALPDGHPPEISASADESDSPGISGYPGITGLRHWQEALKNPWMLLPGGGVNLANAATILRETGCRQLHGSFRLASPLQQTNENEKQSEWEKDAPRPVDAIAIRAIANIFESSRTGE